MEIHNLESAIGNTPLIEIQSLSRLTGCRIFGKAEFMNPGGSVKDRAAKWIINQAENNGLLKSGQTIVEGTAGNTGIGLAMLAASKGYKSVICMPNNQSPEKFSLLKALGAEVRAFQPVPFANENHFYHQARIYAEQSSNVFWANQFENESNSLAHFESTGPEIWQQTNGEIDAFISAVGTGGTISGVSRYLKEKKSHIHICLADPFGSGLYNYILNGALTTEGSSVSEGIGIMRITKNFATAIVDDSVRVSDQNMIDMLFHVAANDGLFIGTSAALNLYASYQYALKNINTNKVIVTVLCDSGTRYQSRLLNEEWLKEKKLILQPLVK